MKVDNVANKQFEEATGNKFSSERKTSILKIPQNEDIFICFMFNEEKQLIEVNYINKITNEKHKFEIDNYPVEKCLNCNCELTIDNTYYFSKENNIELYCDKCYNDKISFNEMIKLKILTTKNKKIIDVMKTYLQNNKKSCLQKYMEEIEKLIYLINDFLILFEVYNALPHFKEKAEHIQNFINIFQLYVDIVNELKMENLYLFLKNILLVSTIKKDESFFNYFLSYYTENLDKFNVSKIHLPLLRNIFQEKFIFYKMAKDEIEMKKKNALFNKMLMKDDLNALKSIANEQKVSFLEKELKVETLKKNIVDFLQKYYYSYNNVTSKKVLELKFINHIIFVIFKYHFEKFQKVKETDFIVNSIVKELKNIKNFLERYNVEEDEDEKATVFALKNKIENEISYYEHLNPKKKRYNGSTHNISKYIYFLHYIKKNDDFIPEY